MHCGEGQCTSTVGSVHGKVGEKRIVKVTQTDRVDIMICASVPLLSKVLKGNFHPK